MLLTETIRKDSKIRPSLEIYLFCNIIKPTEGYVNGIYIFKKNEPRRREEREEREGFLYESGTTAGEAPAGGTIRTKLPSCPAGNLKLMLGI
jgi:hypothetical protein